MELARRYIESSTAEIVLDPFMGVRDNRHSCRIVWAKLDWNRYIEGYCKLARERLAASKKLRQPDSGAVSLTDDDIDARGLLQ